MNFSLLYSITLYFFKRLNVLLIFYFFRKKFENFPADPARCGDCPPADPDAAADRADAAVAVVVAADAAAAAAVTAVTAATAGDRPAAAGSALGRFPETKTQRLRTRVGA